MRVVWGSLSYLPSAGSTAGISQMKKRGQRGTSSFNLAFLDIMFCGFGAVVLLVLIINSNAVKHRKEVFDDLRGEVERLEQEVLTGKKNLVQVKNSLQNTEKKLVKTRGKADQVLAAIAQTREEVSDARHATRAKKKSVQQLETDLKVLERKEKAMGQKAAAAQAHGRKIHHFAGNGYRQYLTGLKLGGKRVLILLDTSASMLDSSIVNVIRRRNMGRQAKLTAPKWQRARRTATWLVANLPPMSSLQLFSFNTGTASVLPASGNTWVAATDKTAVDALIGGMNTLVPDKGTSLINAFSQAAAMQPPPDNILLITDGLPTQGKTKPLFSSVSGDKRVKLFSQAVRALPRRVPVNTILFPMEGDPMAAALYWKLAVDTGGSFFTPAADWP